MTYHPDTTIVAIETTYQRRDITTLARWYDELNSWRWPDDLPNKPDGFDTMPDIFYHPTPSSEHINKHIIITPVMEKIESLIGRKETLRYHWQKNLDETNEAFEKYWQERVTYSL